MDLRVQLLKPRSQLIGILVEEGSQLIGREQVDFREEEEGPVLGVQTGEDLVHGRPCVLNGCRTSGAGGGELGDRVGLRVSEVFLQSSQLRKQEPACGPIVAGASGRSGAAVRFFHQLLDSLIGAGDELRGVLDRAQVV